MTATGSYDSTRLVGDEPRTVGFENPYAVEPNDYILPLLHTPIPEPVVDAAFWSALAMAALFGTLNRPALGIVAAGLFIVRHRHERQLVRGEVSPSAATRS